MGGLRLVYSKQLHRKGIFEKDFSSVCWMHGLRWFHARSAAYSTKGDPKMIDPDEWYLTGLMFSYAILQFKRPGK